MDRVIFWQRINQLTWLIGYLKGKETEDQLLQETLDSIEDFVERLIKERTAK